MLTQSIHVPHDIDGRAKRDGRFHSAIHGRSAQARAAATRMANQSNTHVFPGQIFLQPGNRITDIHNVTHLVTMLTATISLHQERIAARKKRVR